MAEKTKKKNRGRSVLIVLLVVVGICLFLFDQQNRIEIEEIEVYSDRLPPAFEGFRIAHVSDNHGKEFGEGNSGLLKAVAEQRPDIIVITGDLIETFPQFDMVPALVAGLVEIAPTYYVTGNHEWAVRKVPALITLLTDARVIALQNQSVLLERDGERIVLAGIHDPNGPYDQKSLDTLAEEIRAAQGDPFLLLLAHRNTHFAEYAGAGVDLVLTGHGHGGLIRLPFTDGVLGTDRTLFPKWTNGLYQMGETQMVVSRGLGNVGPSFRVFNRPHLPIVILHAGAQ